MRALCTRVCLSICLTLVGIPGFHEDVSAQEPSDETAASDEADIPDEAIISLEPIQVEGQKVRGQKIENIEDVKEKLARRPGSNILIEEKHITETRAFNLQDVLQFAPGVRFQSRFGADEEQFQIRGTSLQNNYHNRGINILINGIFLGDADGFSDFESIDLLAYERIEVYKGANALRYGALDRGGHQLRSQDRLYGLPSSITVRGRQLRHRNRSGLQRSHVQAIHNRRHERDL